MTEVRDFERLNVNLRSASDVKSQPHVSVDYNVSR